MNKDAWASGFYSRFGDFQGWWNDEISLFGIKMPEQRELHPYKRHIATVFGYAYVFGTALLITGEKAGAICLLVAHIANVLVANAPAKLKFEVDREKGFTMNRHNYMMDQILVFVLLMVAFSEMSWVGKKEDDTKDFVKGRKTGRVQK